MAEDTLGSLGQSSLESNLTPTCRLKGHQNQLSTTTTTTTSNHNNYLSRLNSTRFLQRYKYVILGYYLVLIVIRTSGVTAIPASSGGHPNNQSGGGGHHEPTGPLNPYGIRENIDDASASDAAPAGEHGHGGAGAGPNSHGGAGHGTEHGEHGIHVSTVDFAHVATPFIISAWILCACFAKIGFHVTPKLEHIFPESCLLIVIGIIIGLILFYTNSLTPPLTPTTFFLFMLPPIILDAGYFMPNKMFFNNLGTILLFAVIATIWNTFTIGLSLWGLGTAGVYGVELPLLQTLLFSSLISAVDPVAVLAVFEEIHVNEVLYIVVFGESLLNDAVTVVLYHIFEGFSAMGADNVTVGEVFKGVASFPVVALGGTAIGIIWGFVIAFTTRFTNHVRIIEPVFVFVMAYLSYLCAEIFHMSGILAITFCGITMKNYVEANISQKSHTTVKYTMKMMSSSAETIIFVFLGVATIHDTHYWSWWFVIATIVFCSVYRIIGVIIFTYLANHYRIHKLGIVDQFVMSYGGLRGAVAFALVLLIEPETVQGDENVRRMFVTTTITVVFFTVFAQGMTIKPLVEWLKVARADSTKETIAERIHGKLMDHTMAAVETLLGQVGHYNMRMRFKEFDKRFIRPYLIREVKGDEPKILETYARLILEDALMNNPNIAKSVGGGGVGGGGHGHHMDHHGHDMKLGGAPENNGMISPEALAALIKNVLVDTMSDANIANIVKRRKSSANSYKTSFEPNLDPTLIAPPNELSSSNIKHKNSIALSPANIDDLLANNANLRNRRLSYSRHSVNESDIDPSRSISMVNHRVPVHYKKILSGHHGHGGGGGGGHGQVRGGGGNGAYKHKSMYNNPAFNFEHDYDEKYDLSTRNFSKSLNVGQGQGQGQRSAPSSPAPIYTISRPTTPPAVVDHENLPWKDEDGNVRRQNEFPSWVANKDYLCYNSPTNTFLGGITGQINRTTASDVFRRGTADGEGTGTSTPDWLSPPPPPVSRRGSTAVPMLIAEENLNNYNRSGGSSGQQSPATSVRSENIDNEKQSTKL